LSDSPVTIIAEIGVNHDGSIKKAKELIDSAAYSGADFAKFQTFKAEKIITKQAPKANYQKRSLSDNESQYNMIKRLELNKNSHIELLNHCNLKKIKYLSTAFDMESIQDLIDLDIPIMKIPSGEIINFSFLKKIGSLGKPIILSTGMSTMSEISDAVKLLIESGSKKDSLTILHCNTEYPTPYEDVNLRAMLSIRDKFNVKVGYSDHTLGIEVPIAAVAMGASVIEKHFTLDRSSDGPDHAASLEPDELKEMVSSIRNIEKAMGDGLKKPSPSEIKNINIARKSIVASKVINKGDVFTEKNLTVKRPGSGISPMKWNDIINKKSNFNYEIDELIKEI
jgi:N,N'-diacetyllegionaminate synthase